MSQPSVCLLSHMIQRMVPDFDPKRFMSDDTNSFYNGFLRAFSDGTAVKILCSSHILRAIKRTCRTKFLEQWGGFSRANACMNISTLGERFHKRLKHELPDSKSDMRFGRLTDLTIYSLLT
ncbi:hypothetical protein COOONC_07706 [Cooperia oncophora]